MSILFASSLCRARSGVLSRLFSSSPQISPGWIARVKENGVQDLVSGDGFTTNGKFDECARSLRVVSVDEESGDVLARLPVEEHLCNSYDTMHGGMAATLVDIVGTMCCLAKDHTRPGVSVEINVSYASAARRGAELELRGRMLKSGRRLAFTQVEIADASSGKVVAVGRHTKAF